MVSTNRRKNVRVPCVFPAKALGPRNTVRGSTKNISLGGLYLASKDLIPIGTTVDVELTMDGQPFKATGEVRHHTRLDNQPGFGVKFLRLDPAMLAIVQRYVDAHISEAQPETP